MYDFKLQDYAKGMLREHLEVNKRPAAKGYYLADMIY